MTTWPGSWRLLSRSTMVAAGTPIASATKAAASVSHAREPGARCRPAAAANQRKAAAADPQLPGPGRSSPAPRKVPTAQAQAVFLPGAGSLIAGRARPHPLNFFQQLGIEHRRGDAVHSTGPFPQVDGLAMITA